IVLVRRLGDAFAITATNNATTVKTVTVKLPDGAKATSMRDILSGALAPVVDGAVKIDVPAMFGVTLISP
ncbi:MAG: hypothetical protein ABI790_03225, partial [Betaproteobacteria bacterium]